MFISISRQRDNYISLFICRWILRSFPYLHYCENVHYTWECRYLFKLQISFPLHIYPEMGSLMIW